jgi:hypothetical protein
METNTLNPYSTIGEYHKNGLDFIIDKIEDDPNKLNTVLCDYISKLFNYETEPSPVLDAMELASIFTISKNAYINSENLQVTFGQVQFISLLILGIKNIPTIEIPQYFSDIEENISKSNLSQNEKMPLFLATSIGKANYNYWMDQINDPQSAWINYFNSNPAINIGTIPYWVSAAIYATLYFCFKATYFTSLKGAPKMNGPDFVTALTAGLAVGAGKLLQRYIPKIKSFDFSCSTANYNNESQIGAYSVLYCLPGQGANCYDTFDYTKKYPGNDTTQTPFYDWDNVKWWQVGTYPPRPC